MKIPEKLKIGGHVVDVRIVSSTEMPTKLGQSMEQLNFIRVWDGMPESQTASTLLHEIIEYIDAHYELKLEHPKISTLAQALFQILRDNDLDFKNKGAGI